MKKEFKLSERQRKDGLFKRKDVKEFIKIIEARIYNKLRIHWKWLKNKSPVEVADFIENIIDTRAGDLK